MSPPTPFQAKPADFQHPAGPPQIASEHHAHAGRAPCPPLTPFQAKPEDFQHPAGPPQIAPEHQAHAGRAPCSPLTPSQAKPEDFQHPAKAVKTCEGAPMDPEVPDIPSHEAWRADVKIPAGSTPHPANVVDGQSLMTAAALPKGEKPPEATGNQTIEASTRGTFEDVPMHPVGSIDVNTGGLSAFSSKASPRSTVPQSNSGPHEVPVTTHISSVAGDIVSGKLIMYDFDVLQVHAITISPQQTMMDLQVAHHELTKGTLYGYDLVGRAIPPTELLSNHAMLLVCSQEYAFHQDTLTKTVRMMGKTRLHNLLMQGGAVASDEMHFYLSWLQSASKAQVIPPLTITDVDDAIILADAWRKEISIVTPFPVVSAILFHQHWIPVVLQDIQGSYQ